MLQHAASSCSAPLPPGLTGGARSRSRRVALHLDPRAPASDRPSCRRGEHVLTPVLLAARPDLRRSSRPLGLLRRRASSGSRAYTARLRLLTASSLIGRSYHEALALGGGDHGASYGFARRLVRNSTRSFRESRTASSRGAASSLLAIMSSSQIARAAGQWARTRDVRLRFQLPLLSSSLRRSADQERRPGVSTRPAAPNRRFLTSTALPRPRYVTTTPTSPRRRLCRCLCHTAPRFGPGVFEPLVPLCRLILLPGQNRPRFRRLQAGSRPFRLSRTRLPVARERKRYGPFHDLGS